MLLVTLFLLQHDIPKQSGHDFALQYRLFDYSRNFVRSHSPVRDIRPGGEEQLEEFSMQNQSGFTDGLTSMTPA